MNLVAETVRVVSIGGAAVRTIDGLHQARLKCCEGGDGWPWRLAPGPRRSRGVTIRGRGRRGAPLGVTGPYLRAARERRLGSLALSRDVVERLMEAAGETMRSAGRTGPIEGCRKPC